MKTLFQYQQRRIRVIRLRENFSNSDFIIPGDTTRTSLLTDWKDEMKLEGRRTQFLSTMLKDNCVTIMMYLTESAIASTKNALDASDRVKSVAVGCVELSVKSTGNLSPSKSKNKELEDKYLKILKSIKPWWKNSNLVSIVGVKANLNLIDLCKLFRINVIM